MYRPLISRRCRGVCGQALNGSVSALVLLGARLSFAAVVVCLTSGALATQAVDVQREVLPLLADRCFNCHGPDEGTRAAGLRLDLRENALAQLDSGAHAVVAGDPDASELVARVASEDDSLRMPPADSGPELSKEEADLLRRWVAAGAPYERHWGFVAPKRPAVPTVVNEAWARNEIDRFVLQRIEAEGLSPSPPATKEKLLRRLSLDLVGLPPTEAEIDAFLADQSPDAYERQVERLLASPHYGERWGRVWLDGARYADSDGYEKDLPRSVWAYRDWVVGALNDDLPYDRFVTLQLAGDLIPEAGEDGVVATGFLRNSTINEEGAIDPEEFRVAGNFERIEILGRSVLGLTVACSQCHDHKYDPFSQRDYYRLLAYINEAEEVTVPAYTPDERRQRDGVLAEVARLEKELKESRPNWEGHFRSWVEGLRSEAFAWKPVAARNALDNALRFLYNADQSVTNWGYNPPYTTSEFVAPSPLRRVTAVRLETLTDPLLPLGGPGRSPRGLFGLSELKVFVVPAEGPAAPAEAQVAPAESPVASAEGEVAPAESPVAPAKAEPGPREVKFSSAMADFACEPRLLDPGYENPLVSTNRVKGPVAYAIDGDLRTAWGIDADPARSNVDREAVFLLAEPLELAEGETLRFKFEQQHGGYLPDDRVSNLIGRFRLSVTDAAAPHANPVPRALRALAGKPLDDWTPRQLAAGFSYWRTLQPEWREVNARIEAAWRSHPKGTTQLAFAPRGEERRTHVLHRGEFLQQREEVTKGTPEALHPLPAGAPLDRRGLAQWLVAEESPTTARAIANRVWQTYFGVGLVATPDDFGTQGDRPSHPELLDWLSVELMHRDWRLKELHRLVALSATYQQDSSASAELLERDPQNRLLARGARVRLDGEVVRDVALRASGLLNPTLGGPPVYPAAPAFLFLPPSSFGEKVWPESVGPDARRRGLYTFRWRSVPHPALGVFDTPPGDAPCVRRNRSNTPLQALATLNEPSFMDCSRALGRRMAEAPGEDASLVESAFRRCVGRAPTPPESAVLVKMLKEEQERFGADEGRAVSLVAEDPAHPPLLPEGVTTARVAAWTAVSRVLLSLDATITKE